MMLNKAVFCLCNVLCYLCFVCAILCVFVKYCVGFCAYFMYVVCKRLILPVLLHACITLYIVCIIDVCGLCNCSMLFM